jgi:hypothetical protein
MLHRPSEMRANSASIGRKSSLLLTTATVLISATAMMTPTPASAFNIGGLIAMASGRYGYHGGHHGRVHEASRHRHHSNDRDDDDSAPPAEKPPPGDKDTTLAQRHQDTGPSQHQPESGHDSSASSVAFAPLR